MKLVYLLSILVALWIMAMAQEANGTKCKQSEHIMSLWMIEFNVKMRENIPVLASVIHKSKEMELKGKNTNLTPFEIQFNLTAKHRYVEFFSYQKTGKLVPFKKPNFEILFHFLHGDSVILHTINDFTGEYEKRELGYHTNIYFAVVKKGYWYAYEFPVHDHPYLKENHAMLGVTLVPRESTVDLFQASADYLSQRFPKQADVVQRLQSLYEL